MSRSTHLPEPVHADGLRPALDITLALTADDAVRAIAEGMLRGRFQMARNQPGSSTWLRTKTKWWMFFLGVSPLDITPWVEKFTGAKVAQWATTPYPIELTGYSDPLGTVVRILPDKGIDSYKYQVTLWRDLEPAIAALHQRGVLVGVSDWFRPDQVAEWQRQNEDEKAQKQARREARRSGGTGHT